jgi:hypothetical protein
MKEDYIPVSGPMTMKAKLCTRAAKLCPADRFPGAGKDSVDAKEGPKDEL